MYHFMDSITSILESALHAGTVVNEDVVKVVSP